MPAELRITATVPLPDDALEQAEKVAAVAPHIRDMIGALKDRFGEGVEAEYAVVVPRPREPKKAEAGS